MNTLLTGILESKIAGGGLYQKYEVVQTLPSTGASNTIYLVPNGGSHPNYYDEYVWIESTSEFEKIGTTEIDLSGYLQKSGGTMTGDLGLGGNELKLNSSVSLYSNQNNGVMVRSGNTYANISCGDVSANTIHGTSLNLHGGHIINVADPTDLGDVITLGYLDGLDLKGTKKDLYINSSNGNDNNDGSTSQKAVKTLKRGLELANKYKNGTVTLKCNNGEFQLSENVIYSNPSCLLELHEINLNLNGKRFIQSPNTRVTCTESCITNNGGHWDLGNSTTMFLASSIIDTISGYDEPMFRTNNSKLVFGYDQACYMCELQSVNPAGLVGVSYYGGDEIYLADVYGNIKYLYNNNDNSSVGPEIYIEGDISELEMLDWTQKGFANVIKRKRDLKGASLNLYVNGTTGHDYFDGTSSSNPVKSMERIFSLLENYTNGDITVHTSNTPQLTKDVHFNDTSINLVIYGDMDLGSKRLYQGNGTNITFEYGELRNTGNGHWHVGRGELIFMCAEVVDSISSGEPMFRVDGSTVRFASPSYGGCSIYTNNVFALFGPLYNQGDQFFIDSYLEGTITYLYENSYHGDPVIYLSGDISDLSMTGWTSEGTANIVKPEIYSTVETDTGNTWVDGKRIYCKTLNLSNKTDWVAGEQLYQTGITDASRLIKAEGSYLRNDGVLGTLGEPSSFNAFMISVFDFYGKTTGNVNDRGKIRIRVGDYVLNSFTNLYITLYYTK